MRESTQSPIPVYSSRMCMGLLSDCIASFLSLEASELAIYRHSFKPYGAVFRVSHQDAQDADLKDSL